MLGKRNKGVSAEAVWTQLSLAAAKAYLNQAQRFLITARNFPLKPRLDDGRYGGERDSEFSGLSYELVDLTLAVLLFELFGPAIHPFLAVCEDQVNQAV